MKFLTYLFPGLLFSSIIVLPSSAQITVDGTTSTDVSPTETGVQIDNGDRNSGNLFHSFGEFSVPTGTEAFFNNANEIVNIFSRVTGGNISNIDGILRANGAANLFLINPAGIVFGENASLQLGGSFYGSTADSIIFPDGEFSATDLENPPLITINAPIGLGFRDQPAEITVRGNGNGLRFTDSEVIDTQDALRVNSEATIGLIGGNLFLENATIKTAGGSIELGSVAGGTVDLVETARGFTFDYSAVENFGDISLTGTSIVDASGLSSGAINVTGNNIAITGVSGLISHTLGSNPGEDINVFAAESLTITGVENELNFNSAIVSQVFPSGTADAGDINIETGSLVLGDRSVISTFLLGQGRAGNISIEATERVILESQGNTSAIVSGINSGAIGNGGEISITTGFLTLLDGARLNASTSGQGQAGDITIDVDSFTANNASLFANSVTQNSAGNVTINARDTVTLNNDSSIFAPGADRGSITIEARNLEITSGSRLNAGIFANSGSAEAQAGDIIINLTEDLLIDTAGSQELTFITNDNFGTGNAGNIEINARNISLLNGSNITSNSLGQGNIGNITLNATGDIVVDGENDTNLSQVNQFVAAESTGNVGSINLQAQNLTLTNGGRIGSGVAGTANSGNINVSVADTIIIDSFAELTRSDGTTSFLPSEIDSIVGDSGNGNSGDINISTNNLLLSRNGQINSTIFSQGNAGNISIDANVITMGEPGNLMVAPSNIRSVVFNSDSIPTDVDIEPNEIRAGDITINTGSLSITDGADINAGISSDSVGNGGNININATESIFMNGTGIIIDRETLDELEVASNINSDIFPGGMGNTGNLTINTPQLSLTNRAFISADVRGTGDSGNIEVNSEQLSLTNRTFISATIFEGGQGTAGSLDISATDSVELLDDSSIVANIAEGGEGSGGNLFLETRNLLATDGSQIGTSTFGEGNAGSTTIRVTDTIELIGLSETGRSGLFASALVEDGTGGDIVVSTGELIISDGATITVSNFSGLGLREPGTGEAGNLRVEANSITLDNDAVIDAATQSGNGGNITFEVAENLTLRNNSLISARAFNQANGGNINIDAELILAFPNQNNDIIANAQQGRGGNINITVESLFGIEERPLNSVTNDINASSDFGLDGTVFINTLDTNSLRGTAELPVKIVTSEVVTSDACTASQTEETSGLAVRGKGGVPAQPTEPFEGEVVIIGEQTSIGNSDGEHNQLANRELSQSRENSDNPNFIPPHIQPVATTEAGEKLYLARGVIKQDDGTVILTAYPTTSHNSRDAINSGNCQ
ncbi:Filamentous hemagglutinin family N-terminal domain [Hyella patelloides LEGE 07179]|uniref:Filamentous hemagglutinin family N-terminal domain n=1 Tax=Hyella patelloides LEGE 07179 TaxID=945734 RepID=A0A563VVV6_9CYAN|nr:filamentous hemagglutinin N-terminal domain-containing protein [Hyella patelloides]VEP15572.1 Filamentous hemagglutinin family N-terminal domain [Hyella patelloides LEGE 07179]